jgi:hypothetical protein
MNRIRLMTLLSATLVGGVAHAQYGAITGYCDKGATPAITSGLNSTNTLQGIVPGGPAGCLVTVYLTGTTNLATIYSNASGGTQTNPFRASLSGQWLFYVASGIYDVNLSGGLPPNAYPPNGSVTKTGLVSGGGGGIPTTPLNALVKINGGNGAASGVVDNGTSVAIASEQFQPDFGISSVDLGLTTTITPQGFTGNFGWFHGSTWSGTQFLDHYYTNVWGDHIYGPGYSFGNNGTSGQGWSTDSVQTTLCNEYTRGLETCDQVQMATFGAGDNQIFNGSLLTWGGATAASDEGIDGIYLRIHQFGAKFMNFVSYTYPTLTTNTSGPFYDSSYIVDITQQLAGGNSAIQGQGTEINSIYVDFSTTAVPTNSTALAAMNPASCSSNSPRDQIYQSVTCTLVLSTSPASPGNFNLGSSIFLSGEACAEEVTPTAVGANVGGQQIISFQTRCAWDNANGNTNVAIAAQGGPGGSVMVPSVALGASSPGTWGYFVVGSRAIVGGTRVYVANCYQQGGCNGKSSLGMIPSNGTAVGFFPGAEVIRSWPGEAPEAVTPAPDAVTLATNHVPFTTGDALVDLATADLQMRGGSIITYQYTPCYNTCALWELDSGGTVAPTTTIFSGNQFTASTAQQYFDYPDGAFNVLLYSQFRPVRSVIEVGQSQYVTGASGPYIFFKDDANANSTITFTPSTGRYSTNTNGLDFTNVSINSNGIQVGGSQNLTGIQGSTGTKFLAAGTVSGTGATLCTDASGNATTSGCASVFTGTESHIPVSTGTGLTDSLLQDNGTTLYYGGTGGVTIISSRKGTFVCTGGGTISVANTNESATSDVVISLHTAGGTISTAPAMKTVTPGTGFSVLCGAADTSTYNYSILN